MAPYALLRSARLIFWDFDGVIKDSNDVKTDAFVKLFNSFGEDVVARIRAHTKLNGGMSRFIKIPLYLSWVGLEATPERVQKYCESFSNTVVQAVINSPWIPGILDYLNSYRDKQAFILVTATPQAEIEHILSALHIKDLFLEIHGAPKEKFQIISDSLVKHKFLPRETLMIGDSLCDLRAAELNAVPFVLRWNQTNRQLLKGFTGLTWNDEDYE